MKDAIGCLLLIAMLVGGVVILQAACQGAKRVGGWIESVTEPDPDEAGLRDIAEWIVGYDSQYDWTQDEPWMEDCSLGVPQAAYNDIVAMFATAQAAARKAEGETEPPTAWALMCRTNGEEFWAPFHEIQTNLNQGDTLVRIY